MEQSGRPGVLWIRRDRGDGALSEMPSSAVYRRLKGAYRNLYAAMQAASEGNPLSSGMADYWPKPENVLPDDRGREILVAQIETEGVRRCA